MVMAVHGVLGKRDWMALDHVRIPMRGAVRPHAQGEGDHPAAGLAADPPGEVGGIGSLGVETLVGRGIRISGCRMEVWDTAVVAAAVAPADGLVEILVQTSRRTAAAEEARGAGWAYEGRGEAAECERRPHAGGSGRGGAGPENCAPLVDQGRTHRPLQLREWVAAAAAQRVVEAAGSRRLMPRGEH